MFWLRHSRTLAFLVQSLSGFSHVFFGPFFDRWHIFQVPVLVYCCMFFPPELCVLSVKYAFLPFFPVVLKKNMCRIRFTLSHAVWQTSKKNLHHFHTICLDVYVNVASWTVSPISATEDYNSFRITVGLSLALLWALFPRHSVLEDGQFWGRFTVVPPQQQWLTSLDWASRYIQCLGNFLCHRFD